MNCVYGKQLQRNKIKVLTRSPLDPLSPGLPVAPCKKIKHITVWTHDRGVPVLSEMLCWLQRDREVPPDQREEQRALLNNWIFGMKMTPRLVFSLFTHSSLCLFSFPPSLSKSDSPLLSSPLLIFLSSSLALSFFHSKSNSTQSFPIAASHTQACSTSPFRWPKLELAIQSWQLITLFWTKPLSVIVWGSVCVREWLYERVCVWESAGMHECLLRGYWNA